MDNRLLLHSELEELTDNLYHQPPSNIKLKYPCIIYSRGGKRDIYADDELYLTHRQWSIMVINEDPDECSRIADVIHESFEYCSLNQYYTMDSLNHATLTLYY